MDDADLRQLEREVGDRSDLLLAHALAHYIYDGHPFELAMRSPNAIPWLEHGQYLFAVWSLPEPGPGARLTRVAAS